MNYMGERLQLWAGSGSTSHTLACATSLSVNINADAIDVSCKDTGKFGSSIPGKISWDISSGCLYATSGTGQAQTNNYKEMVNKMISGEPVLCTWAAVSNYDTANAAGGDEEGHIFNATTKAVSANDLFWGYAVITSIELTADNGSLAEYSITLQGKGAINSGGKGYTA